MKTRARYLFCRIAIALLLIGLLHERVCAAAGDVDLSFDPGSGINGPVHALAVQTDGKVIIGGGFTIVRGFERWGIARLNPDGSGDSSFYSLSGGARSIVLQPDGKVLAGGADIRRLNPDGSFDPGFNVPVITDHQGNASGLNVIALQPDGRILIGGGFKVVNGAFLSGLARLHADGSLDTSFAPALADDLYSGIHSIAVQHDGKVVFGGQYAVVNSEGIFEIRGVVARLESDGSPDSSFNRPTINDAVWAVKLQPDGKILAGGIFTSVNETPRSGITRLDVTGALDATFIPAAEAAGWTRVIDTDPGGKIITGRYLLSATGVKLQRLNADGSVDGSFHTVQRPQPAIFALAVQPDGKILAGGADLIGNHSVPHYSLLERFNADGSLDRAFVAGGGIEGQISSVVPLPDGKVIIGGSFEYIQGTRRSRIARLDPDGNLDTSFNPPAGIPVDGSRILLQTDGKILASGYTRMVDGEGAVSFPAEITRLNADGSVDAGFHVSTAGDHAHGLVALQPDGRLIVTGGSVIVGEVRRHVLVRLHLDGSLDNSFRFTFRDGEIKSVVATPAGKVLIGGSVVLSNDSNVTHSLLRLHADGSLDPGFQHLESAAGNAPGIWSLVLQSDGKLLIGGIFDRVQGHTRYGIARLHANGSLDAAFDAGLGTEFIFGMMIAAQPDGKVLMAGAYPLGNDEYLQGIFRLHTDGSLDRSFDPGPGPNGGADVFAPGHDGSVIVAGGILSFHGFFRQSIARLHGDPAVPVSFAVWAAQSGLSGAAAAADADPDKDGLANGVEYVLGGNPSSAAMSGSARPVVTVRGENMLFTFLRDDASETVDVSVKVESGLNLIAWPNVFVVGATTAGSSPGVTVSENGTAPDTITVAIPIGTVRAKFARLKVTISP